MKKKKNINIILDTFKKSNKLTIYKIEFPEGKERKSKIEKDQKRYRAKLIRYRVN